MKLLNIIILSVIKFMFEYNLFKKKEYKIRTYIFEISPISELKFHSVNFVNDHNFQEKSVRDFLVSLTDEFWFKSIDYGIELLHVNAEGMPQDVDLTKFTFSELVLIYLALDPEKLGELWDRETIKRWTPLVSAAILATMHEYVINCTRHTKKEVMEVLNDSLFELSIKDLAYEANWMKSRANPAHSCPNPPPRPKPRPPPAPPLKSP